MNEAEKTMSLRRPFSDHGSGLEIDTGNFYGHQVGPEGVTPSELDSLQPELVRVCDRVRAGSAAGLNAEFAALNLPDAMQAELAEIDRLAVRLRNYRDLIVIGIGGSSLGTKAICQAVAADNATGITHTHFVENVDPDSLTALLAQLEASTTAVLCISKSGGTIETVAQYLVLRDWLTQRLGTKTARHHQYVITDPHHGWLRDLAIQEDLASLSVPPQVGGRYSVLSPVGLLPLAVLGINIEALLHGARENALRNVQPSVSENKALEIAALCYLLDTRHAKHISVMMPYINRLQLFVDWYRQLWAESLGKWDRSVPGSRPAGSLPVRAMGAIDQHSQLQMYLESRHDKFFTFIELAAWHQDLPIPLQDFDVQHFPYLRGQTLAGVIQAEFQATRQVITDAGHPNMTIRIPAMNANVLGQLIDLYQRVTVYTGLLYGINPLDQPSVETGKRLAIQMLRNRQLP